MGDSVCSCSLSVQEDLKGEQALIRFLVAFKAAANRGIGFYAQIFVRTSLFFAARFTLRYRVRFSTQNQGFQCSLFLCELNFKR